MKRKKPSFNEAYHGYRTFSELLEDAQKEGLLELETDKRSRTYVVTRFGSEMNGAPAPPAPKPRSRRRRSSRSRSSTDAAAPRGRMLVEIPSTPSEATQGNTAGEAPIAEQSLPAPEQTLTES
jgi:hypothetical protein